jgi:uncharacterized damage-inducible protein DinB
MFRKIEDFTKCWKYESATTLAVLDAVPTAKMKFGAGDAHRDLGRLAWHLVESCVELPDHLGLKIAGPRLGPDGFIADPVPPSMEAIRKAYAEASASVAQEVAKWSDADLDTTDQLYGETWTKGKSLYALIVHQTHHRGQMTVLMRQAGLKLPEVYGPTRDMWVAYGKEAPVI